MTSKLPRRRKVTPLTPLDHFAGLAMQTILSAHGPARIRGQTIEDFSETAAEVAALSYEMAAYMLLERAKE